MVFVWFGIDFVWWEKLFDSLVCEVDIVVDLMLKMCLFVLLLEVGWLLEEIVDNFDWLMCDLFWVVDLIDGICDYICVWLGWCVLIVLVECGCLVIGIFEVLLCVEMWCVVVG